MRYWLLKTEPEEFSWNDLLNTEFAVWDGIRNFQAKNNLKEMKTGDLAFIYHSGKEKAIAGLAKVISQAFPDTADEKWLVIKVKAFESFNSRISLSDLKSSAVFSQSPLLKQSRLSVVPVTDEEADYILKKSSINSGI